MKQMQNKAVPFPKYPLCEIHASNAFRYGGGYDLAARRKNATRESTATLKAWLNEHKKNPYPTKGEKIMLAIITKMTLTQVRVRHYSYVIAKQSFPFLGHD